MAVLYGGPPSRLRMVDDARQGASSLPWASKCGVIGACLYLAGFALPLQWDLPLLGLALFGTLAAVTRSGAKASGWSPLTLAVVVFLFAIALSTLVSEDIGRSVRLSAPLLPGMLLFFLVAEHFTSPQDTRLVYITFSARV